MSESLIDLSKEVQQAIMTGTIPHEKLAILNAIMQVRSKEFKLAPEEAAACSEAFGALLRSQACERLLRAAEGLLSIQQPLRARELLAAATAEPMFKGFKPLEDFVVGLRRATDHADSFERYAARYSGEITLDPPSAAQIGRNVWCIEEAKKILAGREAPQIMAVGPWCARTEEVLLREIPGCSITFVELGNFQPHLDRLEAEFPGRVSWFRPMSYYDLPKRTDGYDLTICNEVLEHQPSPISYLAFLAEQSANLLLSVPEADHWYSAKDCIDPVNDPEGWFPHLHGFNAESFERVFKMVDLPVRVTRMSDTGHLLARAGDCERDV
jgi:hypothetical protein